MNEVNLLKKRKLIVEFSENLSNQIIKESLISLRKENLFEGQVIDLNLCPDGLYRARQIIITSTIPFRYYFSDELEKWLDETKTKNENNPGDEIYKELFDVVAIENEKMNQSSKNESQKETDVEATEGIIETVEEKKRRKSFTIGKSMELTNQEPEERADQMLDDSKEKMKSDQLKGIENQAFQDSVTALNETAANPEMFQDDDFHKWNWKWTEYFPQYFSILSVAITLGNIYRLPRMVYLHGEGAFLLVYTIIMLIFGIPLTFLEIGIGQFCQRGPIKIWRAVNLLRGVGYVEVINSFITSICYMVYMAVSLSLFTWCARNHDNSEWTSNYDDLNSTLLKNELWLKFSFLSSPSKDDLFNFGINVLIFITLWILVFICAIIKNKGYEFSVIFAFLVAVVILVAMLVNFATSVSLSLEWSDVFSYQVWYFSFVQMLLSLQLGFGTIGTCAGAFHPKTDAFWSAIVMVLSNLAIGIANVFLMFFLLGESKPQDSETRNVSQTLFIFSTIYTAISQNQEGMQWASAGCVLVAVAGFSSAVTFTYNILIGITGETKKKLSWRDLSFALCLISIFIGVIFLIPESLSVPNLLDQYVINRIAVLAVIVKLIGFAYIYGCKNLYNDFEFVIGKKLIFYWKILWTAMPVIFITFEIFSAIVFPLNGEILINGIVRKDETWKYSLGWCLYFISWILILAIATYQIRVQVDYNLKNKFLSSIKTSRNWGPIDPIYRYCWLQYKNKCQVTGERDFSLKRRNTRDYAHSIRNATIRLGNIGVTPSS